MKMKSLLFIAAAGIGFAAFATDYEWTGNAGDGKWTTVDNWRLYSGGATASDYPRATADHARFTSPATVTVDTEAELVVGLIAVHGSAGVVTLNGTAGSYLNLNKGASVNGSSFMVLEGSKLVVNLPVMTATRIDKWQNGEVEFTANVTSTVDQNPLVLDNGKLTLSGTAAMSLENGDSQIGNYTNGDTATFELKDSASVSATNIYVTINGTANAAVGHIVQNGDGTVMNVSGGIVLAKTAGHAKPSTYELNAGTLNVGGTLTVGSADTAQYVQTGGTSTISKVSLANSSTATLSGGVMKIGKLSDITVASGSAFKLAGGTLELSNESLTAWNWASQNGMDFAAGSSVALVGSSSLSIPASCSTYDVGLEIGAGKTVTVADGATITAPRCSTNVWNVTLNNGAVFKLASRTARVFVPLDLAVNGSGKVQMYNSASGYGGGARGTVVAHRLVVDGVEKAKGRYTAAASDFLEAGTAASVKGAASILVPAVWTGAGGNTLWSNPANWDNNTVPNGSTAIADVSRAETVTLDQDVALNALVAMPNGIERKVTITGSGKITLCSSANYQCNIFLPEGCELVLDANLTRDSGNVHGVYGGGKLTVKKTFPGCTSGLVPYMAVDGTLAFAGTAANIANIPTSNYAFLSLWSYEAGEGNVLFEDGTVFSAARLWNGANDYVQAYDFRQTGGTVTFDLFYLNNGNNTSTRPPCYYLEGGFLTVNAPIRLGISLGTTDTRKRFPGGSFEMSGGTLDCQGFYCGRNQNYVTLYGGTVYLKGNCTATAETATQTNRNDYTYYLGGVTIRPTGTYRTFDSGNIYFTGKNGDTVFDMSDYIMAIMGGTIAGPGGFVLSGPKGTATLKGAYTNTGTIRVTGGVKVDVQTATLNGPTKFVVDDTRSILNIYSASSGNACKILKSPDVIVLAAESCLALNNQSITVKRFIVGNADYAAGTYSIGGGTVTVSAHPVSWLDGTVGDLSYMADGTTTTVDAATTLSSLTYDPATAGETNTLTGAALTFEDGANIHVEKGATLVIDNDVVFAGKITKTGWGEVVFNGAVTSAVTPAADDDNYWLTITEGGATFDDTVEGVRIMTCGAIDANGTPVVTLKENCRVRNYGIVLTAWNETNVACCGETHQEGATVDYSTTIFDDLVNNRSNWALTQPRVGGYGRYVLDSGELRGHNSFHLSFVMASNGSLGGTFELVQNGGTFILPQNWMFSRVTSGVKFTYTLNDGRFEFGGYLAGYANPALNIINLNGGTWAADKSDTIKREVFALTTSGEVTFEVADGKTLTIADDSGSAASFVKTGAGSLVLDGAFVLNGLDVQAGSATLTEKMLPFATGDAALSLARGVTLDLDYDGQMPFKTLTVGGIECDTGVYSATKGTPRVKKCLGGTGELCILTGSGPGCVIKIR